MQSGHQCKKRSTQLAKRLTLINQQLQHVREHPRVRRDAQRRRHGREPALKSLRVPESNQWHSAALSGTQCSQIEQSWPSGSTHVMYGRARASQTAGGGRWRPFVPPAGPSRAPSRSSATWRAVASGSRPSRSARSMEQAYDQLRGIVWPMESSSGGDDEQISSS